MTGVLEARPLEPFGVELMTDLSGALSSDRQAELVRLVDRHSIIIARDQKRMSLDDNVLNRDKMLHHSDFAYAHTPYKYLSLMAVDVVEGESFTTFANGALAYERLSPERRKRLAALTTTACSTDISARSIGYDLVPGVPTATHPAVIYHHRTTRPILYVNEAQTGRFNELGREDSDALLDELFAVLYSPDAILTHHWRPGDLLIFDNWALQHSRPSLGHATTRRIQRVSVADVGGGDMLPGFLDANAMEKSAKAG